jgi:DNA mismatch endonuclease, patch repair protein
MQSQRERDTRPELLLRQELHKRGLRYFVHRKLLPNLRREADIVFARARVAVFVDGCFWHSCPEHGTWPGRNADWWRSKLERNRARDCDTDRRLHDAGWAVVRVWEHEQPEDAADRIEALIRERRPRQPSPCGLSTRNMDEDKVQGRRSRVKNP